MTPVPFKAEPLGQLQARFPRALQKVFDQFAIESSGATRPGQLQANVFDFEDGLRLIVSREQRVSGQIVLHVSASFQRECAIVTQLKPLLEAAKTQADRMAVAEGWAATIPGRYAELAGDTGEPITLAKWSDGMIPHFTRVEAPKGKADGKG